MLHKMALRLGGKLENTLGNITWKCNFNFRKQEEQKNEIESSASELTNKLKVNIL